MAKKQPKAVRIEITRDYPRGGRVFKPGRQILVPDYAVPGIVDANPPFGKVIGEAGDASGPLAGVQFASPAARKLAEDKGLTTADFEGREPGGESGHVVDDVEAILAERDDPEA